MSDQFSPISISKLLTWILEEEKESTIFGVHRDLFYRPETPNPLAIQRYGQWLDNPLGVAAGPHTQLSQNIILSWLCGARYIELKTIQTLDELDITRPCIDMEDEGYNCEWSQELALEQSFDQYLDAWIIIHLLREKLGFPDHGDGPGFIFNMSVGYDLKGIKNDNVQWFLDKMGHCPAEIALKMGEIRTLFPNLDPAIIPNKISDNVTLSTMHGCPPEEIENIARYLMRERGLHTTVKLNPTLLGPDRLRQILNEKLGSHVHVPDEAFAHDLKYDDAVGMITRLREIADTTGVEFGIKLSNTLETLNQETALPAHEKMVYMSGRALHPLTVSLAARLQQQFKGELDISFSGGADCFSFPRLIRCGLAPVTVCSDLLKPGGYSRLSQYLDNLRQQPDLAEILLDKNSAETLNNLRHYAEEVIEDERYHKNHLINRSIKGHRNLLYFDCIKAPCIEACPVEQAVPDYMHHAADNSQKALEIIINRNPLPMVTGTACDQPCRIRCVRNHTDNPLLIREIKRYIAKKDDPPQHPLIGTKHGLRASVIGAGPGGLSFAFFAALEGFETAVYEARSTPGGMVADVIPRFRLGDEQIDLDIQRFDSLGINILYNTTVDAALFEKLRTESDMIFIATGAQESLAMEIPGEEAPHVIDVLEFLSAVRKGQPVQLNGDVAVIGGGNSAFDAVRTAKRLTGSDRKVVLIYRRSISEMPANPEEILAAKKEGIQIYELTQPVEIIPNGNIAQLVCQKTRLGGLDASGRRSPVVIKESEFSMEFGTVIPAVGQVNTADFMNAEDLQPDRSTVHTALNNVFIGGDALRGPSSIIQAIADGRAAVYEFMAEKGIQPHNRELSIEKGYDLPAQQRRAAKRRYGPRPDEFIQKHAEGFQLETRLLTDEEARQEAARCLYCDEICNLCVSVCPNRANISYRVSPATYPIFQITAETGEIVVVSKGQTTIVQEYQVANITDFCNQCGNCFTFCPTMGSPYRDKPRICLSDEEFQSEDNVFHLDTTTGRIRHRQNNQISILTEDGHSLIFERSRIRVTLSGADLSVIDVMPLDDGNLSIDTQKAAEMKMLLDGLRGLAVFKA